VDSASRRITWLGGLDDRRRDSAVYPGFTAGGTLSYGHWVDTTASVPLVDVFAGSRRVARAYGFSRWAWSPRRNEVAFGRFTPGRRTLELVLASVGGATRVRSPSFSFGASWLPDGSGLVFTRRAGSTDVITFVRRDGRGRRDLARNAVAPVVSPDGRRVAFLRPRGGGSIANSLWVVPLRGGPARRLHRPAVDFRIATWLTPRELLVQLGGRNDVMFDAGDTVVSIDVETGRQRRFLTRAFPLSLSPDGRRLLFVRPHRGNETYYSIRTIGISGRGERLLAVTDEEDLNIGSRPVWKPAGIRLSWFGDEPSGVSREDCEHRVTAVRNATR
jgi:WD40-like Beta Propeller Repeat